METYYKKIEIKSEDDLPKKDLLCYHNYKDKIIYGWFRYNQSWSINDWLDNVDWYLLPIKQEQKEVKSAEEKYLLSKSELIALIDKAFDALQHDPEYKGRNAINFINSMDISQSQSEQREVTDEEIKFTILELSKLFHFSYNEKTRWIEGAKWMRDKIKSIN